MSHTKKHNTKIFKQLFIIFYFVFGLFPPSAFSQNSQTAKAMRGDGIYSLLKRHNIPVSELQNFINLNKERLTKNNQLVVGRTYFLPAQEENNEIPQMTAEPSANKKNVTHKIFGSKYEQIEITDQQLDGAVYYLISGHGGPDPGAIGKYGEYQLCEDEYAYDVTLRLARNLIQRGATVYMIIRDPNDGIRDEKFLKPDKDEVCYPNLKIPSGQLSRLRQRKDAVNKLYAQNRGKYQRLVVIHVDSRSRGQNIDVFFYHDERSKTGKKLALNLQETFDSKYRQHQPGRGYQGSVSDRELFVVKNSYPPAVFIELGNINHKRDQQRFIIENNRQAVANWLYEGLLKDFGNNR